MNESRGPRGCVATRQFIGERLSPKPENSQFILKFFACTPLAATMVGRQPSDQILDEGAPQVHGAQFGFKLLFVFLAHGSLSLTWAVTEFVSLSRNVEEAGAVGSGPSVESRDTPTKTRRVPKARIAEG